MSLTKIKNKLILINSSISSLRTRKEKHSLITKKNLTKPDIFIWGCNEFSSYLYQLLMRNNVNVLGFIEHNSDKSNYCNKPVYTPQTFKAKTEFNNIPIVIASPRSMKLSGPLINFESIRLFKLKLIEIVNDHKITNHLLHPSALIDVSNCTFPNKIITFGMQGSGNTIYNHIFNKLKASHTKNFKFYNFDTSFFIRMCLEYEQCIKTFMTDLIYSLGGHEIMITPREVGHTGITFTYNNQKSAIHSLHTRDQITHRTYAYHMIPSMEELDNLFEHKFKIFFMVRNPLDVIISLLKKRRQIDQNNKIDLDAFHSVSRTMVRQFARWKPYIDKLDKLSYEKLIENPVEQILYVMKKLNLKPSESIAKAIWDEFGLKPLPNAAKTHFGGGGTGKWEKYFKPEHLAFLSRLGIENTLKDYGYLDVLDTFTNKLKSFTQNDYRDIEINKPGPDFFKSDDDTKSFTEKTYPNKKFIENGCFYIDCKDEFLMKKMQNTLNTDYIKKLVDAATLPTLEENQHSIQTVI